jgi:PfpI family intracellular protease
MTKVLIITGDGSGPDLDYAVFRLREEGISVTIAAPTKKRLLSVFHQLEPGWDQGLEQTWYPTTPDVTFEDVNPADYDGLLLPGGRAPVYLRNFPSCLSLVRHFIETSKPIATICRGAILLPSAGAKGRNLTGHPLIRPRIEMGGCNFIERREEPVIDGNIISVSGRPFYHIWIRAFLEALNHSHIPALHSKKGRILFALAESTSSGIHDYAWFRMLEEGHDVTIAAQLRKPTRTVVIAAGGVAGGVDTFEQRPGLMVDVDVSFDELNPADYDGLVIPGGPGPEYLRANRRCIEIAKHFVSEGKPITGICHGPNVILEALHQCGIRGKRISANVVLQADVIAAGCEWVHQPGHAVIDGNIVTAWRRPDYDVWMRAFTQVLRARGFDGRRG